MTLFQPVIESGKSDDEIRAILFERWRALLTYIGVPPSVLLHDAKAPGNLLDALLQDKKACRTTLLFLAERAFAGFRVVRPPGMARQRNNIPLYLRYREMKEQYPKAKKVEIARRLLKLKRKGDCHELRALRSQKAVVNAITNGQRQWFAYVQEVSKFRGRTSLLSAPKLRKRSWGP